MGSKRCEKCGFKVNLKYHYCPYCGIELKFTEEEQHLRLVIQDKEKKRRNIKEKITNFLASLLVWVLLLVLAVLIMTIIQSLGVEWNFV